MKGTDKLTTIISEYKKTQSSKKKDELITKAQNIVTPIVIKLISKWHFKTFPKLIYSQVFEEAKTRILLEAISKFNLEKRKNCKFTSFFATTLNFYLRQHYMKFFQKGKPILKRWGRLNEISLDYKYGDGEESYTLKDILATKLDLRKETDLVLLKQAFDKLKVKDKKILNEFSKTKKFNKQTQEVIYKLKELL